MIEGINLTKSFGEKVLFKGYNFKINTGEMVCFSGKSGSGKTTMLHMIGMLETYDEGQILINGKKCSRYRDKLNFFRSEVGFLFQNYALIENKTVLDNLELVQPKYRTQNSIEDVLEIVNLKDKMNQKVYTLSGGEQQRIALARLYLKKCSIILADEPTGSLDQENADRVMETLFDLNTKGKTVILVTHDEGIKGKMSKVYDL